MPGMKTIYDKNGFPLSDIRASVIRSSLLNDVGEAVFRVAVGSNKCRQEFLNYGNYIVVRHESLPAWVGIIDTPRAWRNGYVEVHAYEVPLLLQYRFPPLNTIINGTPGEKVSKLIDHANAQGPTIINAGSIYMGGAPNEQKFNNSVYYHIKNLAENNGHDWTCSPEFDSGGKLIVAFNWHQRAGFETDTVLQQGKNVLYGETPLEESGILVSQVEAVTDIDSSAEGVKTQTYTEETYYGLRALRVSIDGTVDSAGLLTYATQMVQNQINPSLATPLTIVDDGRTFQALQLGNVISYRYTNVGFSDTGFGVSNKVRVAGWRFDESTGQCELFTGVA